jgi:glycosyltransferase involved in cell wall biosynthesis
MPSLAGGGMERMRIHLIREWIRCGVQVDLVVSQFKGALCEQVPREVRVFELARRHPTLFPFGLSRYIKHRKPTHILSAANDINAFTLLIALLTRVSAPIVISVHNHLSSELELARGLEKIKLYSVLWLLKHLVHRARAVVAVSQGVATDLKQYLSVPDHKLHVIYNPVITGETRVRLQEPLNDCPVPTGIPWILFVGRLVHAKGIDLLFDAFQLISGTSPAHMVLAGEGPLKEELILRARSAGLDARIHFVGFQSNPMPWMREASVLVLSSRHEGLPNVLIEAMACGTQVVATDCPSGPAEILCEGKYGRLVPVGHQEFLATAITDVLDGSFHVPEKVLVQRAESFSAARSADMYLKIIQDRPLEGESQ